MVRHEILDIIKLPEVTFQSQTMPKNVYISMKTNRDKGALIMKIQIIFLDKKNQCVQNGEKYLGCITSYHMSHMEWVLNALHWWLLTCPGLTNVSNDTNILHSYRHLIPKSYFSEIPDNSGEKKLGTDWVLPKITGRVGNRESGIGYPSDTALDKHKAPPYNHHLMFSTNTTI